MEPLDLHNGNLANLTLSEDEKFHLRANRDANDPQMNQETTS